MKTYYELLDVPPTASPKDIKAAFRRKIKALHPDTKSHALKDHSEVHNIIEAYNVLSSEASRADYDKSLKLQAKVSPFNYRDFLASRDDDESRGKLIFYDILRDRTAEAVRLYSDLVKQRTFSLEKALGKEDFMDCAFMLALEFESLADYAQALHIYLRISQLEAERPYFRHFFVEVEERLLALVSKKITWQVDPVSLVHSLNELLRLDFKPKTKAQFLKKQVEIYLTNGQPNLGREALQQALKLTPRDSGLQHFKRQLGLV